MKQYKPNSLESKLLRSWWLIAWWLLCLGAFEHSAITRKNEYAALEKKREQLLAEQSFLLQERTLLLRQIQSQKEPAWIELTLMRVLGMAPEDQKKVFFSNMDL